ncbi:Peptidyl-prolyl cis-trans isomerase cyp15 [Coemansia erecta]|uniref:peptidylprolyl isomerase n=1 Tax=Coemansia erecta TaxID=147472 RepID=A0A9W7Y2I9_9FUNG|nr:Peptidyl-prolyl cis-trans isomerase cyp15 [Coemansia erecta]
MANSERKRKVDTDKDVDSLPSTGKRAVPSSILDSKRIERLPCAEMYERSYMHRDTVEYVVATKTGFVITISADGHVKFWKKRDKGIEFVKDFRAHLGAVTTHALSPDGMSFATASTDKQVKIFDIVNFDMIGMISVGCLPDGEPKREIRGVHRQPVKLMEYNTKYKCVVSVDSGGMVEYWTLDEPCSLPSSVSFSLKSQTDLYEFKKNKYTPTSMALSPDNELFVCTSSANTVICVFKFASGKLYRKYDESIAACNAIQQSGKTEKFKLDDMEFGRRMAVENELLRAPSGRTTNAVFDESAGYLAFASLFGIKIVNLVANKAVCVLGKPEPYRFVNIALIQGIPDNASRRVDLAASANPAAQKSDIDPTILCTAFKKNRFYMFTREEPDHTEQGADRDIFNEKPTREEASLAIAPKNKRKIARSAIIRTTVGDIHLALFPELAPKAVENFAVHSQNGYYNGVIFHRVIKRFMIQTGDPLGDGTGGESIWKRSFEDEFTPKLRHDHPFTLSMANAGPCTNGSQFFLTTIDSAPWLDDKHTIFGRATSGADVIRAIEAAKTDKRDKPFEDISIMNIQISHD